MSPRFAFELHLSLFLYLLLVIYAYSLAVQPTVVESIEMVNCLEFEIEIIKVILMLLSTWLIELTVSWLMLVKVLWLNGRSYSSWLNSSS